MAQRFLYPLIVCLSRYNLTKSKCNLKITFLLPVFCPNCLSFCCVYPSKWHQDLSACSSQKSMTYSWFLSAPHFLYSIHQLFLWLYVKIISWFQLLSYLTIFPRSSPLPMSSSPASTLALLILPFPRSTVTYLCKRYSRSEHVASCVSFKLLTLAIRTLCNFVSAYWPLEPHSLPLSPFTATLSFLHHHFWDIFSSCSFCCFLSLGSFFFF